MATMNMQIATAVGVVMALFFARPVRCEHARLPALRYALVIGANEGWSRERDDLEELKYADRDAEGVAQALIEHAHFEKPRVATATEATQVSVTIAISALRLRVANDLAVLGPRDILLLVYYSGHGEPTALLLNDGPLPIAHLIRQLNPIGAKFVLGIFDSCKAGGLADAAGVKGSEPAPAFDRAAFGQGWPLDTQGIIWLLSSKAEQWSNESDELGAGVMTHFFLEGMRLAGDGDVVMLIPLLNYALERTKAHVAERSPRLKPQEPDVVTDTRGAPDMPFSRRVPRTAQLIFGSDIHGAVVVRAKGAPEIVMHKSADEAAIALPVHAGEYAVSVVQNGVEHDLGIYSVNDDDRRVLGDMPNDGPNTGFGSRLVRVADAPTSDDAIASYLLVPATTVHLGAGWRGCFDITEQLLAPAHIAEVVGRVDVDRWVVSLSAGYGAVAYSAPNWSYDIAAVSGRVSLGYGFDLDGSRVTPNLSLEGGHAWQRYDSGDARDGSFGSLAAGLSATWRPTSTMALEANLATGLRRGLGSAIGTGAVTSWMVAVQVGLIFGSL